MKALVISAGEGTRLGKLTRERPKGLVQLLGLSLIERVILTAKRAGIDEFLVVTGYLGEKIRAQLTDGSEYGVKIAYVENTQWRRGNGVSVLKAKGSLKEDFILLMSDHIFDDRILRKLASSELRSSVILAVDRREPLPGDVVVLERKGKIVKIGKGIKKSNCVDTGIFLCSPKIFSYLEEAVKEGKEELVDGIRKAAENRDAQVFDITHIDSYVPGMRKEIQSFWIDIDTKEDLAKAKEFLIENACKGRNDLLATYVNKPIENFIAGRLANTRITPNQVTILTNIISYISTFFSLRDIYCLLPSSPLLFHLWMVWMENFQE